MQPADIAHSPALTHLAQDPVMARLMSETPYPKSFTDYEDAGIAPAHRPERLFTVLGALPQTPRFFLGIEHP
ncbi:MAG TPA: hypothetical protein VK364_11625 [Hymenobacter sp.]|nr:hypothetical protein [Hymenobacter sp.]